MIAITAFQKSSLNASARFAGGAVAILTPTITSVTNTPSVPTRHQKFIGRPDRSLYCRIRTLLQPISQITPWIFIHLSHLSYLTCPSISEITTFISITLYQPPILPPMLLNIPTIPIAPKINMAPTIINMMWDICSLRLLAF